MNKKIKALAAVAMSAAVALTGCHFVTEADDAGIRSKAEKGENDNTVVAQIDGHDMSLADFNMLYYDLSANLQQYAYSTGATDWESMSYPGTEEEFAGMTMGQVARQMAVEQGALYILGQEWAKEKGFEIDDDVATDAEDMKKSMIQNIESNGNSFQDYLDMYCVSEYTVDKYMQRSLLVNELIEDLSKEGGPCYVSDKDVEDTYVKASHVLIMIDDDTTDEQALEKANEVVAKLDAGEDMSALIKEYGEDPGMESQDYYVFTEGEMVDEFYQAALALEPNQYTKTPVKTSYGYHVIYRYPLTSADEGYEDVTANKDSVKSQMVSNKFTDALKEWAGDYDTKVKDDVLDEVLPKQAEQQEAIQQKLAESAAQQAPDNSNANADIPELQVDPAGEEAGDDDVQTVDLVPEEAEGTEGAE